MLTERKYGGEFLLSEAPGTRSREAITIAASQTLLAGSVLGKIALGALSAAAVADAGNTAGSGTIGAVTVAAGTPAGKYRVSCIEPAANGGVFRVEDPNGVELGIAKATVAASIGGLGFTISDATDFVAGDAFTITVTAAAGSGRYVGVNPAATDGSQHAAAVLYDAVTTASGETAQAVAIVRDAELIEDQLDFGTLNTGQVNAAKAELEALGLVLR